MTAQRPCDGGQKEQPIFTEPPGKSECSDNLSLDHSEKDRTGDVFDLDALLAAEASEEHGGCEFSKDIKCDENGNAAAADDMAAAVAGVEIGSDSSDELGDVAI